MRRCALYLLTAVCLVTVVSWVSAAPFEPVFKVENVSGKCLVKTPGSRDTASVEEGKAYPYGSRLRTARRASLTIVLSEGNRCDMAAQASLLLAEDPEDKGSKRLILDDGKISLSVEEGVGVAAQNKLDIETRCSIVRVVKGGDLSVDALSEGDLNLIVIRSAGAEVGVMGLEFSVALIGAEDYVSIACALDQTFLRLKNIQGKFDVKVTDADGNPRIVKTTKGSTIKIWRKLSEEGDAVMITVLLMTPEGDVEESINSRRALTEGEKMVTTTKTPSGAIVITKTSTSTTTTTTTTTNRADAEAAAAAVAARLGLSAVGADVISDVGGRRPPLFPFPPTPSPVGAGRD